MLDSNLKWVEKLSLNFFYLAWCDMELFKKKKSYFKSYKLKCYVYHVALAYDSFNSYFNY